MRVFHCSCLLLFILVNLNRGTSETNISQKDFTGINEDCGKTKRINENGSYSLEIKENCDKSLVHLDFENPTSIIDLTVSIQYLEPNDDSIKIEKEDLKSTFKVVLCDLPPDINTCEGEEVTCKGKKILKKEWEGNEATMPLMISHLSRSPKVCIEVSGIGSWSYYNMTFACKEIQYRLIPSKYHDEKSMVSCDYVPNSVRLLQLEPKTPQRGIEIWFNNLTINTEMGEYVLIGAGIKPFENKYSRPLYVTQVKENSTFFVDDSSAFVAFVSGSVQKSDADKKFEIQWKGIKADTGDTAEIIVAGENSSLICFYNYSKALNDYEKDGFEQFRQLFANISKTFLQGEYERIQDKIDNKSVQLLGAPMKTKEGDALAILIRVVYGRKSIFTWSTLQTIIAKSKVNGTRVLGYEVNICPQSKEFLPNKEKWKWDIVFYALVPVFGIFGLMMWAWKQNLFSQNCQIEKEEKVRFDSVHAEPNMYGTTTICKLRYEEGGRETIQGPSLQDDTEGAKDTAMVEMNAIPSTSQETPDTLTRYLSGKKKKSRPSLPFLQSLLDNAEESKKQSHSGNTEGNESDHLYDSVSSSKELDETKL